MGLRSSGFMSWGSRGRKEGMMENHSKTRIYGKNIEIDGDAARELYSTRAEKSGQVHVDAPTVQRCKY